MWRSCSQTSVSMAKMSSTKVARPTMFATRSRPPSRACASSTTLRAPSGSVTSPTTATPPTSSATFAARTGSRSATATRAPAWARSSDVSRPIPYPPPTTSAALPSNPNRSSNVIVASLRSLIRPLRPPPALFPSRHLHLAFATRRDTRLAHAHAISIWRSLLAGIPGSLTLTPSPSGVRYSPGYPARSRSRHVHATVGAHDRAGHEPRRVAGEVKHRVGDVGGLAGEPERAAALPRAAHLHALLLVDRPVGPGPRRRGHPRLDPARRHRVATHPGGSELDGHRAGELDDGGLGHGVHTDHRRRDLTAR